MSPTFFRLLLRPARAALRLSNDRPTAQGVWVTQGVAAPGAGGERLGYRDGTSRGIAWWATLLVVVGTCCAGGIVSRVSAQSLAIPEAEALYVPTPARLAAIRAAAQRDGWAPQTGPLQAAATLAYERDKLQAAEAWLHVARWARLLAEPETDFVPRWIAAVNAARVGHRHLGQPTALSRPVGASASPELQAWMIGNAAFSAEFFGLLAPVDHVPRVLAILDELHRRDPVRFKSHVSLALAIALVYDVAPPPWWPHGQVSEQALPRRLPAPTEAFAWWLKQEQNGRLFHRLTRLGAGELKFVVDVSAPFVELEWAQQVSTHPLSHLAGAYTMIRYRNDRVANNTPHWPGRTYRLHDILAAGGICSDQAYFATQVAKARGVPSLLFYGAGNTGRHAWFGYLDGNQAWQLDAGRYAEQRFVTGFARDPQTWRELTDHELQFISQRFRELPSFRQSQVHASFATELLAARKPAAAAIAARKAVNFEKRNQPAWEALIEAAVTERKEPRVIETVLREAALAFQRYPDLEAAYLNRVATSLRARGETAAADHEVREIARKNRNARGDLSVQQARDIVQRAIATEPLAGQIKAYYSVLESYGRGAGMGFFDQIVVGFTEHLVQLKQVAEAAKAVQRARHTLKVEPGSQLETEFSRLEQLVRAVK
jgi:hypothetical protein